MINLRYCNFIQVTVRTFIIVIFPDTEQGVWPENVELYEPCKGVFVSQASATDLRISFKTFLNAWKLKGALSRYTYLNFKTNFKEKLK